MGLNDLITRAASAFGEGLARVQSQKAGPNGAMGYGGLFLPHGSAYGDVYQRTKAPTPLELGQQLVGVAYACVALRADSVAANPLRLMIRTGEAETKSRWPVAKVTRSTLLRLKSMPALAGILSDSDDVEEIRDHPALDIIRNDGYEDDGQPTLSGHDLLWLTSASLDTWGRGYWLIKRGKPKNRKGQLNVPLSAYFLRTPMVKEIPDPSGEKVIDHYEYGGSAGLKFSPEEIIRFRVPDITNPYYGGYSPLMAAIEKIRIGRQLDAQTQALLDNMGRPDAIWAPKGDSEGSTIGEAEAKRLRTAIRTSFAQGGRGGVFVSEYPGALTPLSWQPGDIVELERADRIKTDILNLFGVPDAVMNRNAANLASAQTADRAFKQYAVLPQCSRIATTMQQLLAQFDKNGRFFWAFDNPVSDDDTFALQQTKLGADTGALKMGEIRQRLNAEPLDGEADEHRMVPRGKVAHDKDGNALNEPDEEKPKKDVTPKGWRRDESRAIVRRQLGIAEM